MVMTDYRAFMEKAGVPKKKYLKARIQKGLTPGITSAERLEDARFPDSARGPYTSRGFKLIVLLMIFEVI